MLRPSSTRGVASFSSALFTSCITAHLAAIAIATVMFTFTFCLWRRLVNEPLKSRPFHPRHSMIQSNRPVPDPLGSCSCAVERRDFRVRSNCLVRTSPSPCQHPTVLQAQPRLRSSVSPLASSFRSSLRTRGIPRPYDKIRGFVQRTRHHCVDRGISLVSRLLLTHMKRYTASCDVDNGKEGEHFEYLREAAVFIISKVLCPHSCFCYDPPPPGSELTRKHS
jgi:hypothetical protein